MVAFTVASALVTVRLIALTSVWLPLDIVFDTEVAFTAVTVKHPPEVDETSNTAPIEP